MRAMTTRCLLCRREMSWESNYWRPFCSERCQLTDLGAWAAEWYRMPGQPLTIPTLPSDSEDNP
ncbi:MAG: DNA gyrase inhibitor YacG [Nitrospiraceae bacterium]